ncbi:MAG: site-specific integrase [Muribaculaceae bacterium]|nr:site-specific integrase [Muribaculaceae bacterium]
MTVREACREWLDDIHLTCSLSTWRMYGSHARQLEKRFGDTPVEAISARDVYAMKEDLIEAGHKVSTVKQRVQRMLDIIKFASTIQDTVRPLNLRLRWSEARCREKEVLSLEDHRLLFASILADMGGGHWEMLPALISMTTGLRISEVCGLHWEDLKLRGSSPSITVRRQARYHYIGGKRILTTEPKTNNAYRTVPLLPQVRDALRAYRLKHPEAVYVIGGGSMPVTAEGVRKAFNRYISAIKVKDKVSFHGLRHTFATILVGSGCEITAASRMLGHSSVTITMDMYVHPSEDQKRKSMKKAFETLSKIKFQSYGEK